MNVVLNTIREFLSNSTDGRPANSRRKMNHKIKQKCVEHLYIVITINYAINNYNLNK